MEGEPGPAPSPTGERAIVARWRRWRRADAVLLLVPLLAMMLAPACRRSGSPEDQVRQTIGELEKAVEDKDLKAIRRMIADGYSDGEEHDRAEVLATLQMLFRRHPAIHVASRITSLELADGGRARVTVFAALASHPLNVLDDVTRLQAEVQRFDLTLVRSPSQSGQWQVSGATWQPARPQDLF